MMIFLCFDAKNTEVLIKRVESTKDLQSAEGVSLVLDRRDMKIKTLASLSLDLINDRKG